MALSKREMKMPLGIRIKKLFELLGKYKKIIIGLFLLGGFSGYVLSILIPKIYTTSSIISFSESSIYNNYLTKSGDFSNEISLLQSNEFLDEVRLKLYRKNIDIRINELSSDLEYTIENKFMSVIFKVSKNDPSIAASIANAFAETFKERSDLMNKLQYINYMKLLVDKGEEVRGELQNELVSRGLGESSQFTNEQNQIILSLSEMEAELESIELDNRYKQARQKYLSSLISSFSVNSNTDLLSLNTDSLNELKTKLERINTITNLRMNISSFKASDYSIPWRNEIKISELQNTERQFEDSLSKLIAKNISAEDPNKEYLNEVLRQYYFNNIELGSIELMKTIIFDGLTRLESRFNRISFDIINKARELRTKNFFNRLLIKINAKIEKLKAKENSYYASVEEFKSAKIPENYVYPNTTLNILFGSLIGIIIGMSFVFITKRQNLEFINNVDDLDEFNCTVISQIPSFPNVEQGLFNDSMKIDKESNNPKIIDAFKTIETFLKYGSLDNPLKTILISSGQSSEGKSVVASNIALALANSGNKVLLVDADLKHPQLNKIFKIKSTPSLAHYLFRKKELNEIIRGTHNENLKLITCIEFPQNPSVIITSERMANFMESVKKDFDYIIYDTSSLCTLKETVEIIKVVDELLIVVRSGYTKLSDFLTTEDLLREYGIVNFNIILNDVKS